MAKKVYSFFLPCQIFSAIKVYFLFLSLHGHYMKNPHYIGDFYRVSDIDVALLWCEHFLNPWNNRLDSLRLDSLEIRWIWYEAELHEEAENLDIVDRSETSPPVLRVGFHSTSLESCDASIFHLKLTGLSFGPFVPIDKVCRHTCRGGDGGVKMEFKVCLERTFSIIDLFIASIDPESFRDFYDIESGNPAFHDFIDDLFCRVRFGCSSSDCSPINGPSWLLEVVADGKCYIVHMKKWWENKIYIGAMAKISQIIDNWKRVFSFFGVRYIWQWVKESRANISRGMTSNWGVDKFGIWWGYPQSIFRSMFRHHDSPYHEARTLRDGVSVRDFLTFRHYIPRDSRSHRGVYQSFWLSVRIHWRPRDCKVRYILRVSYFT